MAFGGNNFNDFPENHLTKTPNLPQNPQEAVIIATNIYGRTTE